MAYKFITLAILFASAFASPRPLNLSPVVNGLVDGLCAVVEDVETILAAIDSPALEICSQWPGAWTTTSSWTGSPAFVTVTETWTSTHTESYIAWEKIKTDSPAPTWSPEPPQAIACEALSQACSCLGVTPTTTLTGTSDVRSYFYVR
jgi:hypothetical protein